MRGVRQCLLAVLAAGAVPAVAAQSLLYRPPNLSGTWVPPGGVLQFNFLHRFVVSAPPTNKVNNYPTFVFALGIGHQAALGVHYASNSVTVQTPYTPNEIELYARARSRSAEGAKGFTLSATPAYNFAAQSFDGEAGFDYTVGRFTASAAARGFTNALGSGEAGGALAGGLTFRLNDYIALGGDVASMVTDDSALAWSAGLSFVIPGSPHTFSLHASNTRSTTLQGASFASEAGGVAYGFEFTIPIHFSRFAPWFAKKSKDKAVEINVPFMNTTAAQVEMREFSFRADSVVITAGQSVGWINRDQVAHTVTFESGGVQSSGDMAAGGTFVAAFARPGVYRYHCAPHPNMKGVVVVK